MQPRAEIALPSKWPIEYLEIPFPST
jgi:hypothetical protein